MDTLILAPKVAAATLASAHAGSRAGLIRQGMKIEDFEWYLSFHEEHDVKLHSGAGVGMARVAQFILGQTDISECVPFLINRDNVI
ncbi:hypothetical protein [uncultured Hymenobacter sp.]|uniref:hypothetical protein n=1 Tax=uncultured Hymenobacter sp. TaxID=170016 RepID=UPI0035CA1E83